MLGSPNEVGSPYVYDVGGGDVAAANPFTCTARDSAPAESTSEPLSTP